MNAGQTCLSVERCYVHHSLYSAFTEACSAKAKKLRVGNGMDPSTEIGPLINERQVRVVEAHVEDARQGGARVLTGGVRLPELGPTYFAPTVLTNVDHTMRLMQEETFGPLLLIMPFSDDAEGVRLANDSNFGLAASVWTKNRVHGERIARQIKVGTVMINDAVSCFGISEAPHGGVKCSGMGRAHGRWGLEEMVRSKYIADDRLPRMKKIWWFGYQGGFASEMENFIDFLFASSLRAKLRAGIRSSGALFRKKM
jgi:succinate-semialdehyde dehydrogenase/glutarate-semialdehyde dehydrogenase